jgi:hypothetical protein
MFEKTYGPKWGRRGWAIFFTIVIIGVAAFSLRQVAGLRNDINATPTAQADGSRQHPYADWTKCPPGSIIFANNSDFKGGSMADVPRGTNICFVGNESHDMRGPNLKLR